MAVANEPARLEKLKIYFDSKLSSIQWYHLCIYIGSGLSPNCIKGNYITFENQKPKP
jgi:hypothetical protein